MRRKLKIMRYLSLYSGCLADAGWPFCLVWTIIWQIPLMCRMCCSEKWSFPTEMYFRWFNSWVSRHFHTYIRDCCHMCLPWSLLVCIFAGVVLCQYVLLVATNCLISLLCTLFRINWCLPVCSSGKESCQSSQTVSSLQPFVRPYTQWRCRCFHSCSNCEVINHCKLQDWRVSNVVLDWMLSVSVASAWAQVGWVHSILEVLSSAYLFNTSLVSCAASVSLWSI